MISLSKILKFMSSFARNGNGGHPSLLFKFLIAVDPAFSGSTLRYNPDRVFDPSKYNEQLELDLIAGSNIEGDLL